MGAVPKRSHAGAETVDFSGVRGFRYLPQLDGVRALAVGAVMAWHASLPVFKGGGIGVDVFFVLSGYLITSLLLKEFDATGTVSLRHFYVRRARRLLPALVAVALISLVAFAVVRPPQWQDTLLGVVASVFYVSCWLRALSISTLGWFGHTWSLSVEEHFYLLFPPVLLVLLRRRPDQLRRWILVMLGVAFAYRVGSTLFHVSGARINGPDMRAGQLLIGCAVAVLLMGGRPHENGWQSRWRPWLTAAAVLAAIDLVRMVAFPYAFGVGFVYHASLETVAVEAAVVMAYLVLFPATLVSRVLSHRSLVWLGRRSYAIYLWHLPLFGLLSFKGHPESVRVAGRGLAVMLTLMAAWASFKWVESPFYRRRVEGSAIVEGDSQDDTNGGKDAVLVPRTGRT